MQNLHFCKQIQNTQKLRKNVLCFSPQIVQKLVFYKDSSEHIFIPYELNLFDEIWLSAVALHVLWTCPLPVFIILINKGEHSF